MMKLPEEQLFLELLKQGNANAWRYLYEHHYVVLCKIAYDFVADSFLAETIVEDTIFHFWEIRENVDIQLSFRSYLIQAVRNRCLNYLQAEQNKREICFSELPLETLDATLFFRKSDQHPLGTLLENELEQEIEKAVNALPPKSQHVFRKSRFEHKKNEEIAIELGISINTVKYHLKKSLSFLREQLSHYLVILLLFLPTLSH